MKTVVWFQNDLRLRDNPALTWASKNGEVVAVFLVSDIGAATRVWLKESLQRLSSEIEDRGGSLTILSGDPWKELPKYAKEVGADAVAWNRNYEPAHHAKEAKLSEELKRLEVQSMSCRGSVLAEPWEIKNGKGEPYKVFTPYWKNCQTHYKSLAAPWPIPKGLTFLKGKSSLSLEKAIPLENRPWEESMLEFWTPGEAGALKELKRLNESFLKAYPENRDIPSVQGTSRLSPHLHFGELSPRQVFSHLGQTKVSEPFRRQIAWREFSISLLYYFPSTVKEPLNPKFKKFGWKKSQKHLKAWQKGRTGYPIVDAGMRELWATGWMHNRVRMIVGSFLVKHLLIHWAEGAKWFWETLVDADLANNTMGWQWIGGCGADAAPYFRIFNPMTQGKKFDPKGEYVRRWVPELSDVSDEFIHEPWLMSDPPKNYPAPIVDHSEARTEALARYQALGK